MNKFPYTYYYFIGIGGIGMSALTRYVRNSGHTVYGYDRTRTALTLELEQEGISISYSDSADAIPPEIIEHKDDSLIIYTPAIPKNHKGFNYFVNHAFTLKKRAAFLGEICNNSHGIAIAGTHGKTSITTCVAHIMYNSNEGCSAFLGGISKNFKSNFIHSPHSTNVVVEADEFDRSFHNLHPHIALVSSVDADHLDIYGNYENIVSAFHTFVGQIQEGGTFIYKYGLDFTKILPELQNKKIQTYTYDISNAEADFYAHKITKQNNTYIISLTTPFGSIDSITIQIPGLISVENCIAGAALSLCNSVPKEIVKTALQSYLGVKRRLDIQFKNESQVYIDDYAHHPEELRATITSLQDLYTDKKITGIFQPHLYSRTQDFAPEFAQSLSLLDEVIVLDIYPAREEPIEGVSSELIFKDISIPHKTMCSKQELIEILHTKKIDVLVTMGAGDIDTLIEPITNMFTNT
ncbi:MAG: UDP-N-acetylmuramate--L-alanine ligase [Bacteroidales bacterium]|jgi:UDP-N-acetylmuramate--alanine ligase|nr:UDP-N-acetylmuramate--L-alanine ligase [Bacteroidales bacterium]